MLLKDKNIVIMGLRNKWSIAWGAAQSAHEHGANLIFTYLAEEKKESIEKLVSSIPGAKMYPCDVSKDEDIANLFEILKKDYGVVHGVLHSIAHARTEDLRNDFVKTSRDGFAHANNVSAYSLVAVSNAVQNVMSEGGGIVTLTYLGAEKVLPNYNVMGVAKAALECSVRYLAGELGSKDIRVNAVSAGPIKTLSARGVKDLDHILEAVAEKSPLKRNVEAKDVGDVVTFLMSNMSRGVTGEVIHVDSGYNIMGI